MIEHVGLGFENDAQRFFQPLKVRNQYFDSTIRYQFANLADGFGENPCAADVVIVAVHAGDDGVLEPEGGYGFRDAARFIPVNRLGTPLRHRAKSAASGADIAEQHECRGLMIPAFPDVRTLR